MSSARASSVLGRWRRWGHFCTLPWVAVLVRVLVGGVFLFAGFSKLLLPSAEVVALVQQYQVLPGWLVAITAAFLPWIEVGSGTALLIGFCTTPAALLIAAQLVNFSLLMSIVLVAGIAIEDCGCFGNLGLHETPLQVLIRDLIMLALLIPVFCRQRDALGLDAWSNARHRMQRETWGRRGGYAGEGRTARVREEMAEQGDLQGGDASGRFWRYGLWMIGCGFIGLVLLSTLADFDLHLSGYFYDPAAPQKWFLKTAVPWIWLDRYGEYPAALLAIGAGVVWCGSLRRRAWVRYRRACALIVLALALGPGLLVNGILKPLWGRPRPHQIEAFGGSRAYRHWWQPGHLGGGRSFSSGHTAMGYVLLAGVFLVPPRRSSWLRGLALGGALAYGSLVGAARVVQGAHFVSDVLWSGGLMCFTVATLQAVLPAMRSRDRASGFAATEGNLYNTATLEPS